MKSRGRLDVTQDDVRKLGDDGPAPVSTHAVLTGHSPRICEYLYQHWNPTSTQRMYLYNTKLNLALTMF